MFQPATTQRVLSLYFPFLATDRIARKRWGQSWRSRGRPDHPPIVCAGHVRNAVRLVALDEEARHVGLRAGQGVTEARAMIPDVDVVEADSAADRAFLEAIADWCDRYTPLVAFDGDGGLFLDISGSAHLFGGEKALFDDIVSRLFHMGIAVRGAISSAPGLSSAVSRFGPPGVVEPDGAEEALIRLPVRALRLPEETVELLVKSGLKQVGDLLGQPRAPLARRFGSVLMLRLDQALGLEEEAISPRRPVAALSTERRLSEPIIDEDNILLLLGKLGEGLKAPFEARGEGGKLFELLLFRVDGKVLSIRAGTAMPVRDPARIVALFRARLSAIYDDFDAGYGFETLRLNVLSAAPFAETQADLQGRNLKDDTLLDFIDQMSARFGSEILTVPVLFQSHVPERAGRLMPVSDAMQGDGNASVYRGGAVRPLRLFSHPEPVETMAEVPDGPPRSFRWRRVSFRVVRAEGPERISPEWWIDGETAPARDYFRIEDEEGRRYWLYREGLYERDPAPPRWFIQGVFA
ncbi:DNA polymerase Y family protein [Rhizobium setariae]|uniref:DNA polymerase Y family protein n=1 Tax=Rhizobium setariae TaxID=2801340 RepID=UPI001FEDE4FB|nr:DNA polymerase Y family protein [Rhizobium setariae]